MSLRSLRFGQMFARCNELQRKIILNQLADILAHFKPITLSEMDGVQLMNRLDTKFMFHSNELSDFLHDLEKNYRVLEVEGHRQSRYKTLYYDTLDFKFFTEHQNGKRHRFKIRKREYVESQISFLEVKEKSNKGRTAKSRIKLIELAEVLDENGALFISKHAADAIGLEPKLWNSFTRTTLVDTIAGERVTLDTNLAFEFENRSVIFSDIVIAEVKQDGENRHSPFIEEMKEKLIREEGISKYCLGVTILYPEVKSNNFKEKILKINKIRREHAN